MKISVITVCYNSARTVADTLKSVAAQTHPDVEHIVIDGGSKDGTQETIGKYMARVTKFISEPDKGIYDAMNKGVALATGDVIGILNSDDIYAHNDVLTRVAQKMADGRLDALLGDVGFFRDGTPDKIIRRYDSGRFSPDKMAYGWMPAHPAMFLTRDIYKHTGNYRTDYKIAADFEFIIRAFVGTNIRYEHLPEILVKMRSGGVSTSGWHSNILLNKEILRACKENSIATNIFKIYSKYPAKLLGLLAK